MNKTLFVWHEDKGGTSGAKKEIHAETIEQALRIFANLVKREELAVPCTLEFEGPRGLTFTVAIESAEDAHEISTMGFMF